MGVFVVVTHVAQFQLEKTNHNLAPNGNLFEVLNNNKNPGLCYQQNRVYMYVSIFDGVEGQEQILFFPNVSVERRTLPNGF